MRTDTELTRLLAHQHPILLAAMDLVADARLTLAVSKAGGLSACSASAMATPAGWRAS